MRPGAPRWRWWDRRGPRLPSLRSGSGSLLDPSLGPRCLEDGEEERGEDHLDPQADECAAEDGEVRHALRQRAAVGLQPAEQDVSVDGEAGAEGEHTGKQRELELEAVDEPRDARALADPVEGKHSLREDPEEADLE